MTIGGLADLPTPTRPLVLAFAAPSGTGKTTLIAELARRLVARGLTVAAVKHDAHRIELDTPGKDSWLFRQAGADTLLVGDRQAAWFCNQPHMPSTQQLLETFTSQHDVVLIEGFRSLGIPTMLVGPRHDPTWTAPSAEIIADVDRDDIDGALEIIDGMLSAQSTTSPSTQQ